VSNTSKECIACAELIAGKAKLCKHCGTLQSDPRFSSEAAQELGHAGEISVQQDALSEVFKCPKCGQNDMVTTVGAFRKQNIRSTNTRGKIRKTAFSQGPYQAAKFSANSVSSNVLSSELTFERKSPAALVAGVAVLSLLLSGFNLGNALIIWVIFFVPYRIYLGVGAEKRKSAQSKFDEFHICLRDSYVFVGDTKGSVEEIKATLMSQTKFFD
jgi:predicted RNA-binding Zn-ribbon protein involved in translation (DUF1610 family)